MKISSLTSEQRIRLAEMYHEWLANITSSAPLDRHTVASLLAEFYYRIRKPAPRVLVFSSPPMCLLAWAGLTTRQERWEQLRDQLSRPLQELSEKLPDQMEAQIQGGDEERRQLGRHLAIGLAESLRHVKDRVPYALEAFAKRQIDESFWEGRNLLSQSHGCWLLDNLRTEREWSSGTEREIWSQLSFFSNL
jgi:hypothetical protein